MSTKDQAYTTRHRQYHKKIDADSVVLDPGIIAISWEDSTIRLHDGYTVGGRIFPMAPAPSLTVNVLTPLSGNGSVANPIALNIAALANQVPVLTSLPIIGDGTAGNPIDIDENVLAAALANKVAVAHDASLVGNGLAGSPLSVNWGLAPAVPVQRNGTLTGNGTASSPLGVVPASLASQVPVTAISPITGDGTIATPLVLDVPSLIPQLNNKVGVLTDGVTMTGAGIVGNPLVAIPAPATVVTAAPLVGNGTVANPIDINIPNTIAEIAAAGGIPVNHDASLTGNGTTASPLVVNWSNMPALNVQHDATMTGQGTAGNPLSVNWAAAPALNVIHDATLSGSGNVGSPLTVNGAALAGTVPVVVGAGLTGNGTTGSPLVPNTVVLAGLLANQIAITASAPLTGNGTTASPLGIVNAGPATRGVVQLQTSAEGLNDTNDIDAATPAYVDLKVDTAVAGIPTHAPATIASSNASITTNASGVNNQTFDFTTNSGIIPIADAGNYYVGTNIESALQEIGSALGGKQTAITFYDEAIALGLGGDVNVFNVVGNAIAATRAGNTVTLTANNNAATLYTGGSIVGGSPNVSYQIPVAVPAQTTGPASNAGSTIGALRLAAGVYTFMISYNVGGVLAPAGVGYFTEFSAVLEIKKNGAGSQTVYEQVHSNVNSSTGITAHGIAIDHVTSAGAADEFTFHLNCSTSTPALISGLGFAIPMLIIMRHS